MKPLVDYITPFLAQLDWGSFLGGVVGAAGAFTAVIVADKRAEKRAQPMHQSKKVSVILNMDLVIDDGMNQLNSMPNNATFNEVLETIIRSVTRPLQQVLPAAVEIDEDIYKFAIDTLQAVQAGMRKWMDKEYLVRYEHRNSETSYPEAADMKRAVLNGLSLRYAELMRIEAKELLGKENKKA